MDVYDSLPIEEPLLWKAAKIFGKSKQNVLLPGFGIRTEGLIFKLLRATHQAVDRKVQGDLGS